MIDDPLAEAVARATAGDQEALDTLIRGVQDRVYGLAMRMLGHPEDAADATQEILLKLITHLSQFRGESAFSTWAYRVAANHLLNVRASRREQRAGGFAQLGEALESGLALDAEVDEGDPSQQALLEELRVGCTQGMLLCLDRPHRLAFILSAVFDVRGDEGAAILGIAPAAFRQRLARARRALKGFMEQRCGLVSPAAACRCSKQVLPAIQGGRLNPAQLTYAGHPALAEAISPAEVAAARSEIVGLGRVAGVFRSHPRYQAPGGYVEALRRLVDSASLRVLQ